MGRMPLIIPVSDLRQDVADVLKKVKSSKEPIVITQRGRTAAIMVSPELYEEREKERQILLLLAQGERDVAANRGVDLDDAFKEVQSIIEKRRKKK